MTARYGVAVLFVGVVTLLLAIRSEGYLGGRTEGGPLTIGAGGVGGGGPTGTTAGFGLMPSLDGDPVEIQAVRPDFRSPGLNLRAARVPKTDVRCGACSYPRRGKLFVGHDYDGKRDAVVGLRASRPGAYYALDLITDYKRGIRRFRRYSKQSLCIAVGEDARCGGARLFDAPMAEIGGPSDYGVRMRGGTTVRLDMTKPQSLEIPLTNLTDRTIKVAGLGVAPTPPDYDIPVTTTPARFALRAHRGRDVRVNLGLSGCVGGGDVTLDRLRARVDGDMVDVPLTVALQLAAVC